MATLRAGLYVRISDDRADSGAGVGRQEHDCRQMAQRLDWSVEVVYRENDTSAFRRRLVTLPDGTKARRVVRPEFRRMLTDLADGTIEAVIGYDLDRVARDPRDLEDLIDVCEQTHRPARSVTGNLDLSTDAGITMARIFVAIANQASRDTSRRVRREKEDVAAAGRWTGGGKRAYGYTRTRDAVIPAEAVIVREMAARVIAGESCRSIAGDLNRRDVPTASGSKTGWTSMIVRKVVTGPTVAGRLKHRGEVVGQAPWPPILDLETWQQARAEISTRTPRSTGQLTRWLSGVLICARCLHPMRALNDHYRCEPGIGGCGRIWVNRARSEALMAEAILRRAERADPPTIARPAPPPVDDEDLAELAAMWGRKEISLAEYRSARAAILERIRSAERPPVITLPAWAREDLRGRWESLTPSQKRRVALAFLSGILVHPSPTRQWNPDRLEPQWRE